MQGSDVAIMGIKLAFSVAALVLILFVIVRPIWRMLNTKPDVLDTLTTLAQMPLEEENELEIPTGDAKPDRAGMIDSAKSDPNRTARLVSQWLKERK